MNFLAIFTSISYSNAFLGLIDTCIHFPPTLGYLNTTILNFFIVLYESKIIENCEFAF